MTLSAVALDTQGFGHTALTTSCSSFLCLFPFGLSSRLSGASRPSLLLLSFRLRRRDVERRPRGVSSSATGPGTTCSRLWPPVGRPSVPAGTTHVVFLGWDQFQLGRLCPRPLGHKDFDRLHPFEGDVQGCQAVVVADQIHHCRQGSKFPEVSKANHSFRALHQINLAQVSPCHCRQLQSS